MRLTEDVDILIDDSVENIRRLLGTLADYGEGFARELSVEDFTDEEGAIRIVEETEQCQIDIFTRMSGRKYDDVMGMLILSRWRAMGSQSHRKHR